MSRFILKSWQERVFFSFVFLPLVFAVVWKGGWVFKIFLAMAFVRAVFEWARLSLKARYAMSLLAIGFVYISFSFWAFYQIRFGFNASALPALIFLILVFSSDIGAYVFGKYFRGPKVTPTISPNKTWAGMAGAMFAPALAALVIIILVLEPGDKATGGNALIAATMGVAALLGFTGQVGDILVSWLKRAANAKDTGTIIPGHGGLLDRLDSMMLAGIVFIAIMKFIGSYWALSNPI